MAEGKRHFLQWHITHHCNLRCAHCYQEEYAFHMPEDRFDRWLAQYLDFTERRSLSPQINLTGGEPLVHSSFFSFAEELRRRDVRWAVLTNGTLIDASSAKRIASLRPAFVQVSLDGARETHDAIRGDGSFEKALRGVDLLKKENVRVIVSFTAQKSNVGDFSAVAVVCRKHRVDKLWWDRVVTDDTERLALSTDEFAAFVRQSNRLQDKYRRRMKTRIDNGRALQFLCASQPCVYRCNAGGDLLIFLPNGDVMPCRRLPFVIGNMERSPLEQIVAESELMRELKDAPVPEACRLCSHLSLCRGGAKCVTYAQTGQLYARDVNCFMRLP